MTVERGVRVAVHTCAVPSGSTAQTASICGAEEGEILCHCKQAAVGLPSLSPAGGAARTTL